MRASKKRLTFKFCFLGGEQHAIQLVHSVMSGKKVVIADGMTLLEVKEVCQVHTACVVCPHLCACMAQSPSLPPLPPCQKVVGEWRYPFQFRGHLLSVVIDGQEHEYGKQQGS